MTVTAEAIIAAVGVFFGALTAVIIGTINVMRKLTALKGGVKAVQAEVTPNHGSSIKDSLARIEQTQAHQGEMIRSLGHQIGEMRDAAHDIHHSLPAHHYQRNLHLNLPSAPLTHDTNVHDWNPQLTHHTLTPRPSRPNREPHSARPPPTVASPRQSR